MRHSRLQHIEMVNDQPTDNRYSSAILWGLLGAAIAPEGTRLQTGIASAIASPFLEDLGVEMERQQRQEAIGQQGKMPMQGMRLRR